MLWNSNAHVATGEEICFVDVTDRAVELVSSLSLDAGLLTAFVRHTTCGLMINEWETGALVDLRARLEVLFPRSSYYAHDDLTRRTENLTPHERRNGHAHVAQMMMGGSSQAIPIAGGRLALGRWQRLILVELDGPQTRSLFFQAIGSSSTQSRVRNSQNANPAYSP